MAPPFCWTVCLTFLALLVPASFLSMHAIDGLINGVSSKCDMLHNTLHILTEILDCEH